MSIPSNPWDERYGNAPAFYYGTEPNDFLREQSSRLKPDSEVLSLAEGEGRNAVFLASRGHRVTAVDGSAVGLKKLEGLAREKDVQVTAWVADLAQHDIGHERWDAIVSIWCHLPPALRRKVHRACVEGLKPGGVLILEAYRPEQLNYKTGGPPSAEMMMTRAGLEEELEGLKFEILEERLREVHEGQGHRGMSAVVQVLARKP